jgi:glycosidase
MWALIDPYNVPFANRRLLEGWFANSLPDLNQHDPEVARYLIQNTLWWIGTTGLDGIRQDTVPYVPKSFWAKLNAAIRRQFPAITNVGEVYSREPLVLAHFEDAGFRLFDFPLEEQIRRVFIEGERMSNLPASLARDRVYKHPRDIVTFFGSHDIRRFAERSTDEALKNAFTFLITTRGIPLIYYGDEIGMKGGGDPDNRRDFPDPASRTPEQQAVFEHVRTLLHLRKAQQALRGGTLRNLYADEKSYVYLREAPPHEAVLTVLGAFTDAVREALSAAGIEGVSKAGVHVLPRPDATPARTR